MKNTVTTVLKTTEGQRTSSKVLEVAPNTGPLLLYNREVLMKATIIYNSDNQASQSTNPSPTLLWSSTRDSLPTMMIMRAQALIIKLLAAPQNRRTSQVKKNSSSNRANLWIKTQSQGNQSKDTGTRTKELRKQIRGCQRLDKTTVTANRGLGDTLIMKKKCLTTIF